MIHLASSSPLFCSSYSYAVLLIVIVHKLSSQDVLLGNQSFCCSVAQLSPTLWDPMVTNEYSNECSGLISFRIE